MRPATIWLIGCGNMGSAMLGRWIAAGFDPAGITVVDPGDPAVPPGVRVVPAPPLDATPEAIVLAVKPQQLQAALAAVAAVKTPLLLSILAGVEEATLTVGCNAATIVRAMPNLPVAIGHGATALHSRDEGAEVRAAAEALVAPLGLVEWIADEALFDAVTALSGSGPGFVFRFIDALAAAGAALGLPNDQAARLALAMVDGAARLASASDLTPAALADRVASPGGTTREGLDVLDRDDGLATLVTRTLTAAATRSAELARAARG